MSWDNWVILQWSWAKLTLNFVIFTKISKFFLEKINSFKHVFECKTLTYCKNFPQDPKISPNEGSSMTIPWFWYHLPCGKICHSSSFCAPPSTVAWYCEQLILKVLDFLDLGESFRHFIVPLKVLASYEAIKALKSTWKVGGLNPRPLWDRF